MENNLLVWRFGVIISNVETPNSLHNLNVLSIFKRNDRQETLKNI